MIESSVLLFFSVTEMRSYLLRRYNISDPDYKLIETVIIESRPHKAGPQWKFSGAFYFSVVVVAVIGNRFIRSTK